MKIKTLSCDLETYSDLDITKCGVYKYASSPNFEILLFGYSINEGPVKVIDLAMGEALPPEIKNAILDDSVIKSAHNAAFERICLSRYLGVHLKPDSWMCTMVHGAYLGLPLSLLGAGTVLGLEKQKLEGGKALIRYFCQPCKPTKANGGRTRNLPEHDPEKWAEFKEYNLRDVEAEMEIQERLRNFPLPDAEWQNYFLDQEINDRGIMLDLEFVEKAVALDNQARTELMDTMRELTELENPNSVAQLKGWLAEEGFEAESLNKASVSELLEETPDHVSEVLELRQSLAKSSVRKYTAMAEAVCSDRRARGLIQFYGANRTGRFAGRLIQVQNLPRNNLPDLKQARALVKSGNYEMVDLLYDSVPMVLSDLIRTSFIPKPAHKFIVVDFSSIERVVLAWLAGEQWVLDAYAANKDLYIATASQMFSVPIEAIDKKDLLRQKGKVADLACIAEGELVLTDLGLIPIERVTLKHRLWDGESFVSHDGVIFKGEKEVISYEGLTATKDHLVWVEGKEKPIRFIDAASDKAHLVRSGNGGETVWVGKDSQSREALGGGLDSSPGFDSMRRLWRNSVDLIKQFTKRHLQRVPEMLSTKANPKVVGQATNLRQAEMRKSKRCGLQELWGEGNKIRVSLCVRSGFMDRRKFGFAGSGYGVGSNQQRWSLRTGQLKVCNSTTKLCKQKEYGDSPLESEQLALCENGCEQKIEGREIEGANYRRSKSSSKRKTEKLAFNRGKVRVYDILNSGPNNRFTVSGCLVHNCGYGGSVGALKAMGALEMGLAEEELKPLVDTWRVANPNITKFWWDVDRAALTAVRSRTTTNTHGIVFEFRSGMLFVHLPSGRHLSYVKPKIGLNKFGRDCVTYEGIGANRKWERIPTYGPKLVENIVQALSRDLLCYSMLVLTREGYKIVMHIHDEVVIEAPLVVSVDEVCKLMSEKPRWAKRLELRADGFESNFYKKD